VDTLRLYTFSAARIISGRPSFRGVGQDEVAAGRESVPQRRHDPPGVVVIGEEMHDRGEQQPDRLAQVDEPPEVAVGQDALRLAQVGHERAVRAGRSRGPWARAR
jgi:hypothetical protein